MVDILDVYTDVKKPDDVSEEKSDNSDNDSYDDSNSSRENSGDEGFDESSIDPKILAKLAKVYIPHWSFTA